MSVSVENKESYDFLQNGVTHVARDPLWTAIGYDEHCATLLRSSSLMKLHNIRQLGPTALLYPGATHTRYSHSLGVMHLARRVLMQLLQRTHCPPMPLENVKAFLAAALLHDVGHFPYTHSLKELPLLPHEEISASLISGDLHVLQGCAAAMTDVRYEEESPLPALLTRWGVKPTYVAAIVSKTMAYKKEKVTDSHEDSLLPLFRSILSGALDPDKLDYLCRDAFFCGVPYGIQDVDFAIRAIDIDEKQRLYLRSSMPTEHVLFSKYLMYKSVYWHKTIRAATAMVKHALFHAIQLEAIALHELFFLTDDEFHSLCKSRMARCEKLTLVEDVQRGTLHVCLASYDPSEDLQALQDLQVRSTCEKALASSFGIPNVIVDLPEHIAFESPYDYALETDADNEHETYQETRESQRNTVFDSHTAAHFSTVLRRLRVFVPQQSKTERLMKQTNIHAIMRNEITQALASS